MKKMPNNSVSLMLLIISFSLISCSHAAREEVQRDKKYEIIHRVILQPIDHADPEGPKLEQHVDILIPDGVAKNAPVFFNLGNEADRKDEDLVELFRRHGEEVPLIYVQAEHRGYGQSLSMDEDQSIPTYLRPDQALADAHEVIRQLKAEYAGPWMAAGWSYGGGLVIDFAYQYPEDVDVILSSSGVVEWPFLNYAYDRQIRKTLGENCYRRMAGHMKNLQPKELFDDTWYEREFLIALVVGVVQYKQFNRLQTYFNLASFMPTPALLKVGHWLDDTYADGKAGKYAQALRSKSVSRRQSVTGEYGWHAWRYQQCSEVGVFFASESSDGIFRRTRDDFCEECRALFGAAPYADAPEWSLRTKAQSLTVPLIYVSGGKDPWYALCLQSDFHIEKGRYFYVPEGFHCPDRDDPALARQILREMIRFARLSGAKQVAVREDL